MVGSSSSFGRSTFDFFSCGWVCIVEVAWYSFINVMISHVGIYYMLTCLFSASLAPSILRVALVRKQRDDENHRKNRHSRPNIVCLTSRSPLEEIKA